MLSLETRIFCGTTRKNWHSTKYPFEWEASGVSSTACCRRGTASTKRRSTQSEPTTRRTGRSSGRGRNRLERPFNLDARFVFFVSFDMSRGTAYWWQDSVEGFDQVCAPSTPTETPGWLIAIVAVFGALYLIDALVAAVAVYKVGCTIQKDADDANPNRGSRELGSACWASTPQQPLTVQNLFHRR